MRKPHNSATCQCGACRNVRGDSHKSKCNCIVCKSKRGEFTGSGNPNFGRRHPELSARMRGSGNINYKPKIQKICLVCGTAYEVVPSRDKKSKTCSNPCKAIYIATSEETKKKRSRIFSGPGNPMWGKSRPDLAERNRISPPMCGKTRPKHSIFMSGENNPMKQLETREKSGKSRRKERHWNWLGGISFEPYGLEFNNDLRQIIKQRDGYACQLCGKEENTRAHTPHHIDYNKNNNELTNLILLCTSCNSRVNYRRNEWQMCFEILQEIRLWEFA